MVFTRPNNRWTGLCIKVSYGCNDRLNIKRNIIVVMQWLRDRALDSRLRGPVFESCAAV